MSVLFNLLIEWPHGKPQNSVFIYLIVTPQISRRLSTNSSHSSIRFAYLREYWEHILCIFLNQPNYGKSLEFIRKSLS